MKLENLIQLNKEVSQRFRDFMKSIKISHEALAAEMKMPVKLVEDLEEGKEVPSVKNLLYFQTNYNLDLKWLITGASTPVDEEKFIGGLSPVLAEKHCNESEIPVKEEYEELFNFLQVPQISHHIISLYY
ncbi:MAG: helix-turn-helix transcriptional regulator [Candidatus Omnitrophica bacterium]|nr:helix-turn-helix transcriptional regulator [Candidatus Omnitrophota bacterium]